MFASVAVRVHSARSSQGCVALREEAELPHSGPMQWRPTRSTGPLHLITNKIENGVHVEMERHIVVMTAWVEGLRRSSMVWEGECVHFESRSALGSSLGSNFLSLHVARMMREPLPDSYSANITFYAMRGLQGGTLGSSTIHDCFTYHVHSMANNHNTIIPSTSRGL